MELPRAWRQAIWPPTTIFVSKHRQSFNFKQPPFSLPKTTLEYILYPSTLRCQIFALCIPPRSWLLFHCRLRCFDHSWYDLPRKQRQPRVLPCFHLRVLPPYLKLFKSIFCDWLWNSWNHRWLKRRRLSSATCSFPSLQQQFAPTTKPKMSAIRTVCPFLFYWQHRAWRASHQYLNSIKRNNHSTEHLWTPSALSYNGQLARIDCL